MASADEGIIDRSVVSKDDDRLIINGRKLATIDAATVLPAFLDAIFVDLSHNQFVEFPDVLCSLINVESLSMHHNLLRSVSPRISRLECLTMLNLNCNYLIDLPNELTQLFNLEVLSLNNNRIEVIPDAISSLSNLLHLDLSCNNIAALPATIGHLDLLKTLNVRRNRIQCVPREISRLKNLAHLNLSDNAICHLPHELTRLNLEYFNASHNPLLSPQISVCLRGRMHVFKWLRALQSSQESSPSPPRETTEESATSSAGGDENVWIDAITNEMSQILKSKKAEYAAKSERAKQLRLSHQLTRSAIPQPRVAETTKTQPNNSKLSPQQRATENSSSSSTSSTAASPKKTIENGVVNRVASPKTVRPSTSPIGGRAATSGVASHANKPASFVVSRKPIKAAGTESDETLQAMTRQLLEKRLALTLPPNLLETLRDGIILCHFVNNLKPKTITLVKVPADTPLKVKRNVESFQSACRRLGVRDDLICSLTDVVEGNIKVIFSSGCLKCCQSVDCCCMFTTSTQQQRSRSRRDTIEAIHKGNDRAASLRKSMSHSDCKSSFQVSDSPPPNKRKKKPKKSPTMHADLSGTKYPIIDEIMKKLNFQSVQQFSNDCFLVWNDSFISADFLTQLRAHQRVNHFPGMFEICRKDNLARNMAKMAKHFPNEFNFVPKTWIVPRDYESLLSDWKDSSGNKYYIAKPAGGAQGHGIAITRDIPKYASYDNYIVQEYIDNPFLIDGFKFDLRVYALVTSCDPLRAFLYTEGLVRLATEKYHKPNASNSDVLYMHLTNYSVNKKSDNYETGESSWAGSKRSIVDLLNYLRSRDFDTITLWKSITDVILKTILVAEPFVYQNYKSFRASGGGVGPSLCFEILGFDIMLDSRLKPWVLEVNRSPSFGTNSPLDKKIKSQLLLDTFALVNIRATDRYRNNKYERHRSMNRLLQTESKLAEDVKLKLYKIRRDTCREDFESRNIGHYRRIFPLDVRFHGDMYAKLLLKIFEINFGASKTSALMKELHEVYLEKPNEDLLVDKLVKLGYSSDDLEFEFSEFEDESSDGSRCGSEDEAEEGLTLKDSTTMSIDYKSATSRSLTNMASLFNRSHEDVEYMERKVLERLTETQLKFPGYDEEETSMLLTSIYDKWSVFKQQIATYWLVQLDNTKRRKIIDIVEAAVTNAISEEFDEVASRTTLGRLQTRLYNRLLMHNGEGLWNSCNQNHSWEVIFTYSSLPITEMQLELCRRIVQMCRDCLIIVFSFSKSRRLSSRKPPLQQNMVPKRILHGSGLGSLSTPTLLSAARPPLHSATRRSARSNSLSSRFASSLGDLAD